jgi:hypothetical protein
VELPADSRLTARKHVSDDSTFPNQCHLDQSGGGSHLVHKKADVGYIAANLLDRLLTRLPITPVFDYNGAGSPSAASLKAFSF